MGLTTIGKGLVAAGIFGTGIVIGGVTWEGEEAVSNIEGNINNMKDEISQALDDNEYLQGQFDDLTALYESSVQDANQKIESLVQKRDSLLQQIEELDKMDNDYSEDEAEIQAEIDRLEGELQEANEQVAALEATAQAADDEIQYTATDRTQYEAKAKEINEVPLPISSEALELDATKAELLASPDTEKIMEQGYSDMGGTVDVVGVVVNNDSIALEVNSETFEAGSNTVGLSLQNFGSDHNLSYTHMYFMDGEGNVLASFRF